MNHKTIIQAVLSVFLLAVLATSCRKVEYDYIDGKTPDEREREHMEDVRTRLTQAEHGWVGYMYVPTNQKGFTFYMKFAEKNRVTMYSDFSEVAMTEPKESSFSLRNTGLPSLIFDTYNYIHLPADPNSGVSGGPSGQGQSSDFEYSIIQVSDDTMVFKGNLKNSELTLIRLGADQAAKWHSGQLKPTIGAITDYFIDNQNNYIRLADDRRFGINVTHSSRQITYQILESDGTVSSRSATFFYTVDGIRVRPGFVYKDLEIVSGAVRDGKLFLKDSAGTEYEVRASSVPITPLPASFGFKETYKALHIEGQTLPAGVTSGWTRIYNDMVARFNAASNRRIIYMDFVLQNATKARVIIRYESSTGSGFTADAEYDYVIEGDKLTLSNYVPSISNTNWNTRISQIGNEVVNYFKDRSFKIDWVEGTGQETLGGLYPVDDPATYFYGILQ